MHILIDIKKEQDLLLLVALLDRLKIKYERLPVSWETRAQESSNSSGKRSDKYRGKLSKSTGESLQQYITNSRKEWERNT
ncbi:MAG: hypothetical protein JNL02_14715 [Saprospiraceae bacterium]|nr:hypothetical protein [Saprospiraceae bacterium]